MTSSSIFRADRRINVPPGHDWITTPPYPIIGSMRRASCAESCPSLTTWRHMPAGMKLDVTDGPGVARHVSPHSSRHDAHAHIRPCRLALSVNTRFRILVTA
eukprot:5433503-Prymnesium_polylepis.1